MLPPNEIPVYDYRAAITSLVDQGSQSNFTIDAITTTAQVSGDTAKVTLQASGTAKSGKWSLDGGCFTPPHSGADTYVGLPCGSEPFAFISPLAMPFETMDRSSQISVVKQGGRWFVSPVGTVLDVVDRFVSSIDRRSLFTMLNIPDQIPPDGSLTLGQPVVVHSGGVSGIRVLTFAGHAGEQLLGLATSPTTSPTTSPAKPTSPFPDIPAASVRVFAPNGAELDEAAGIVGGQPLTLPADGTYIVVVETDGVGGPGDATVTIWDAANAPAGAKVKTNTFGSCSYGIMGSSCSSSGSASGDIAVTAPTAPAATCATGSSPGVSIGPNGELLGRDGKPIVLPGGVDPGTSIKCIGQNGGGSYSSATSSVPGG